MKIQVFQDGNGKWRWRLRTRNGTPLVSSTDYPSQAKAKESASAVHDALKAAKISVTYQK